MRAKVTAAETRSVPVRLLPAPSDQPSLVLASHFKDLAVNLLLSRPNEVNALQCKCKSGILRFELEGWQSPSGPTTMLGSQPWSKRHFGR